MLDRITLRGFRACGDTTALALGPLSVLAGANNTGKSSFIGALLALIQSQQAASRHRLLLDGEWVDLGPFDELLSPDHQTFSVGLEGRAGGDELAVIWDFAEEPTRRARPEARLTKIEAALGDQSFVCDVGPDGTLTGLNGAQLLHPAAVLRAADPELRFLPYTTSQVLAVGPYRAPPERLSPFRVGDDGPLVGKYGQFAAEAFSQIREGQTDLLPPGVTGFDSVGRAMDAWWSFVLGDEIALKVQEEARLGFTVRLDTSGIAGRSLAQLGFGLSQLWPILVACLASTPGDLVIVETPEAHLHPAAQHRVAALFVALARTGRQVIVETHSEHIVAAACLAVKRAELEPNELTLSFFKQLRGRTSIEAIDVDRTGRRLAAPQGFFDQSTQDLLALIQP